MKENELDKFILNSEQVETAKNIIKEYLTYNKMPVKNPIAIVVGGQSGAGKSGLIGYTQQMFSDNNVIVIENDDFRCFHPKIDQIQKEHPNLYTELTEQLGLGITPDIISYVIENRYNFILHQTLKNNRIADNAITTLINENYTVLVRALAVSDLESQASMIARCQGQKDTRGYCRYVNRENHDYAYNGLPDTVDYIEKTGKYDLFEIYKRGPVPSDPKLIYSHFNPKTEAQTLNLLKGRENVSCESESFGFDSAKEAVLAGRKQDVEKVLKSLDSRIENFKQKAGDDKEMNQHIEYLKETYELYQSQPNCEK